MATSIAPRPNSTDLAVLCCNGDLVLINGQTGTIRKSFPLGSKALNPDRMRRVLYTPDGKSLAVLEYYAPIRISVRDADTGDLRFPPILPCADDQLNCRGFAVSNDSRYLASIVNGRNEARVWDLATGRPIGEPMPHPGDDYGLFAVCFSPNGQFLLTGHKDHQIRYWNWRTGELACPPMDQADEVYDVAITPDGKYAISDCRSPGVVNLWDLESGRPVAPSIPIGPPETDSVETVAISADGHRAYITGHGNLTILDLETWLKPPEASAADISLLAELTTARRIKAGDLNKLTKEEWQNGWNQLQERNPAFVHSGVTLRADVIALRSAENAARPSSDYVRNGEWSQAARSAVSSVDANPEDRLIWASAARSCFSPKTFRAIANFVPGCSSGLAVPPIPIKPIHSARSLCSCLILPTVRAFPPTCSTRCANNVKRTLEERSWYFAAAGFAAYRDNNWETAASLCEKSLEISLRQGAKGSLAMLVLAMVRHKQGNLELADTLLAEATDLIPAELATLGTKEHTYPLPASADVAHHDWQTAEILRREAATLIQKNTSRATDVNPLVFRSLSLLPHNRIDEALADVRKAIALNPRSRLAHSLTAIILWKQGKYDEAAQECLKEIEFHPKDPTAYWILGEVRFAQGDDDLALSLAGEALERNASAPMAHNLLGKIYSNSGRFDEAAQMFLTEIGTNPTPAADAYSNLGLVRLQQGKLEDALATFRKAIELQPDSDFLRYMLAQAIRATGDIGAAISQCDEALKLTPGDPASSRLRTDLLRMQTLLPQLDSFVRGSAKPADNVERVLLARVLMYRGKNAQSARFYAEAITADPKLVNSPAELHALRAATAAAKAGRGDGDDGKLDETERCRFRKQAITHLRTLLDSVDKALPTAELSVRRSFKSLLYHCKATVDFAGIRDPEQVNKLPAEEQNLCKAFWSDLDKLLKTPAQTR